MNLILTTLTLTITFLTLFPLRAEAQTAPAEQALAVVRADLRAYNDALKTIAQVVGAPEFLDFRYLKSREAIEVRIEATEVFVLANSRFLEQAANSALVYAQEMAARGVPKHEMQKRALAMQERIKQQDYTALIASNEAAKLMREVLSLCLEEFGRWHAHPDRAHFDRPDAEARYQELDRRMGEVGARIERAVSGGAALPAQGIAL